MRAISVALSIFLAPSLVQAQSVTVCQGTSSCTVVYGDTARRMSEEELIRKNRSDALIAIGNIRCHIAEDQRRCEQLISELRSLFR